MSFSVSFVVLSPNEFCKLNTFFSIYKPGGAVILCFFARPGGLLNPGGAVILFF